MFLALKKVGMVKITPVTFPPPDKKSPCKISHSPYWWMRISLYPLMLFGKPCSLMKELTEWTDTLSPYLQDNTQQNELFSSQS